MQVFSCGLRGLAMSPKSQKITSEPNDAPDGIGNGTKDEGDGIFPIEYLVQRAEVKSTKDLKVEEVSDLDDENVDSVSALTDNRQDLEDDDPIDQDDSDQDIEMENEPTHERNNPLAEFFDPKDPVSLYFREVNKVPLLTHEEEISLAQRIEAGREARSSLAKGSISEERKEELKRLIDDGWAAREHLITANFRLVISVAKKYIGRGVPFLDLIQDGNIGLIRATKKFDYRRGHRFSTYATWWIRQAISRGVADHGRTIRLPVHLGDQINRLWRETHRLTQDLGREATTEEIADALKLEPKKVEELMKFAQRPLSLELSSNDDDDNELADYTPDEIIPPPVDTVNEKIMQEHVKRILTTLPPREARILQLRYGLLDGKSRTLGEVGRKMGVTRERVRQIEAQALRRLRQPNLRRELQDYIRE
jgi:RNA polymerase primary sigma factor